MVAHVNPLFGSIWGIEGGFWWCIMVYGLFWCYPSSVGCCWLGDLWFLWLWWCFEEWAAADSWLVNYANFLFRHSFFHHAYLGCRSNVDWRSRKIRKAILWFLWFHIQDIRVYYGSNWPGSSRTFLISDESTGICRLPWGVFLEANSRRWRNLSRPTATCLDPLFPKGSPRTTPDGSKVHYVDVKYLNIPELRTSSLPSGLAALHGADASYASLATALLLRAILIDIL